MIDVAVVGAGPAGLATAIHAALAGLETVVLDSRPLPIDKACGEGLMPGAVRMLRDELGVDITGRPFHGIRYRNEQLTATAAFRSGPGLGVRRTALSAALSKRLCCLGIPIISARAQRIAVTHGSRSVRVGDLEARWLVAADGLHSPIRRQLGLATRTPGQARYGLRGHFATGWPTDYVDVFWAARSEAYITPIGPDRIGVAILTPDRGPFADQLARFPLLTAMLGDAEPLPPVRGAGPLRQAARRRVLGRVLLVGDAAGYVDALTGEGLSLAFASSRELVRALVAGRPEAYERSWLRLTRSYRMLTRALLWTRARPFLAARIVPTADRLPGLFSRAVDLLAT